MERIRIRDLQVGGLYYDAHDPDEFFMVLEVPKYVDPRYSNKVLVISHKRSAHIRHTFSTETFVRVG